MTIFYFIRFETSPTWRVKSPYLYPPGTRWPGYTPRHRVSFSSPPTSLRATVEVLDPASTRDLNDLKHDFQLSNILKFNFLVHRKHITSPLQRSTCLCCLGKQSLFIVRTIRNTQIHCVGRMQSFSMLKQVVADYKPRSGTYSDHWALEGILCSGERIWLSSVLQSSGVTYEGPTTGRVKDTSGVSPWGSAHMFSALQWRVSSRGSQ
jgi:hypothetical protein